MIGGVTGDSLQQFMASFFGAIQLKQKRGRLKLTSEVLIFNKRAVVVAADSAVTSSNGSTDARPRYSKSATKIFELSDHGNVAVAIFGGASIDLVPWELAIKLFRHSLGSAILSTVGEYMDHLLAFLRANNQLFPASLLEGFVLSQFDNAGTDILELVNKTDPAVFDEGIPLAERQEAWARAYAGIRDVLVSEGVAPPLGQAQLDALLANLAPTWEDRVSAELAQSPKLAAINALQLAELAHRHRYAYPEKRLGSTGLVVAGFGGQQIFPGYRLCYIHGHVGNELFTSRDKSDEITHTKGSLIVPLAQKSMIDLFTDGFGYSLWTIISETGASSLQKVFDELQARGMQVPDADKDDILKTVHDSFMKQWTRKNWEENYHPLMDVLTSLSVEEMAHLAETLLVLQSLKERVTSASEEVGGPIDVAAITKSEGLVWLKRKHFFDGVLNTRYIKRMERSLQL